VTDPAELGVVGLSLVVLWQLLAPVVKRAVERRRDSARPPATQAVPAVGPEPTGQHPTGQHPAVSADQLAALLRDREERAEIIRALRDLAAEAEARREAIRAISAELRGQQQALGEILHLTKTLVDRVERMESARGRSAHPSHAPGR